MWCKSQALPQPQLQTIMEQAKKYPELTWTQNEYHQLRLALSALEAIRNRESKRHQMDEHLDPRMADVLDEVIGMLSDELDYDPTPSEPGEPPMTMDEMHTAAWKEHQEMHR
jgi:hypothetical protein